MRIKLQGDEVYFFYENGWKYKNGCCVPPVEVKDEEVINILDSYAELFDDEEEISIDINRDDEDVTIINNWINK
jgi:hypothetical protein